MGELCYNQVMQSVLQTKEWAELRESQGWKAHWIENLLVLEKPLPLGLSFLYAPEVDFFAINLEKKLKKIKEIAQKSRAIFTRLDFINKNEGLFSSKIISGLKDLNFCKAFEEIQPEWRQITDINKSEDKILAQMKPKGRYNIRVAQKNGVVVEKSQNIDDFYNIFRETAERDGFEIRPRTYFVNLLEKLQHDSLAELLVCKYNGRVIAAGIFTFYGEIASYLYGASGNEARNVMAPYLMHWEAILEAKRRSCKLYDLLAVAPAGTKENHKYAGITRFKEQFGGRKVHLVGSWDLVAKPVWYWLFKLAEKFRRHV